MDPSKIPAVKKVYFGCSIAGGRDHAHVYEDIVRYIKLAGAQVSSEIFIDSKLKASTGTDPNLKPKAIWQRDVSWVKESDALIMEVTQPSLGVGYEIALAENLNLPVLALFYKNSGRRLSPMIAGNPHVIVFEYSDIKETKDRIKKFLKN